MVDKRPRKRGRVMLSEKDREKSDLLIKLTTYLNHHWNPTAYTATVHNDDVMYLGFINRVDGKPTQLDWFIEKLGAYLDVDADAANQTFKDVTTRIMSEIGFDPNQYLYTFSSPEVTHQAREEFLRKIDTYDNSHSVPLKVHFVATLLGIDTANAYTMLKWAEC